MLTASHIKTVLAWLGSSVPATRIPNRDAIAAALQEQLDATLAPIAFAPLPGGGWHIDGDNYRGRLPKGLGLAYAAIRATQLHSDPPTVPNAHAARKAIRTDAMRWAARHALPLCAVLQCVSVERGEVLFDAGRPGTPKVECVPSAQFV